MVLGWLRDRFVPKKSSFLLGWDKKAAQLEDPLPGLLPGLYASAPKDDFKSLGALRAEVEKVARDLVYAIHLNLDKTIPPLMQNLEILIEIPIVYEHLTLLRRKGLERYFRNAVAVTCLFQCALFRGKSDVARRLEAEMPLLLLATLLRFYGLSFLSENERDLFRRDNTWDISDPKQKAIRDKFLKAYRAAADNVAKTSVDRLRFAAGENADEEALRTFLQLIRFSWRMRGRAAAKMRERDQERLHAATSYLSTVVAAGGAWVAQGKRFSLILAEEWGRMRPKAGTGRAGIDSPHTQHALVALADLMALCRCTVLRNFQGKAEDAIYAEKENLILREVPVMAELKEGSKVSVRRYIRGGKRVVETERETLEAEEEDEPAGRTITQTRWACYRLRRKIHIPNRNLMKALKGQRKRGTSSDPTDDDLELLDEE